MLVLSGILTACADTTKHGETSEYVVLVGLYDDISAAQLTDADEPTDGFIKPDAEASGNETTMLLEVIKEAEVYSASDMQSTVIGKLGAGDSAEIINTEKNAQWYSIVYNGRVAYILSECIVQEEVTEDETTAQQTTEHNTTGQSITQAPTTTAASKPTQPEPTTAAPEPTQPETESSTESTTSAPETTQEETTTETETPTQEETESSMENSTEEPEPDTSEPEEQLSEEVDYC